MPGMVRSLWASARGQATALSKSPPTLVLLVYVPEPLETGFFHNRYIPTEVQHAVRSVLLRPIRIDGVTYEHDVVIDCGEVRKRKKKPSRKFRGAYGHTPLSLEEKIPWKYADSSSVRVRIRVYPL